MGPTSTQRNESRRTVHMDPSPPTQRRLATTLKILHITSSRWGTLTHLAPVSGWGFRLTTPPFLPSQQMGQQTTLKTKEIRMFLFSFFIIIIILSEQTKDIKLRTGFLRSSFTKNSKDCGISQRYLRFVDHSMHTHTCKCLLWEKKKKKKKSNIIFVVVETPSGRFTHSRASPLADLYIA